MQPYVSKAALTSVPPTTAYQCEQLNKTSMCSGIKSFPSLQQSHQRSCNVIEHALFQYIAHVASLG